MKLPYVYGSVLLDGADIPLLHLIQGSPPTRCGWACACRPSGRRPRSGSPRSRVILWFLPTGEPDAPFDSYQEHL